MNSMADTGNWYRMTLKGPKESNIYRHKCDEFVNSQVLEIELGAFKENAFDKFGIPWTHIVTGLAPAPHLVTDTP